MSSFRPAFAALLVASLVGCASGPDAAALQKDVETAIQAKDFAGAVTKADEALKADAIAKDAGKAWRFESLKLQALADGGKGADVKAGRAYWYEEVMGNATRVIDTRRRLVTGLVEEVSLARR
jgi:hypothetical protein